MIRDIKPLQLIVGRWLVDNEQEAELTFEADAGVWQSAELTVRWGLGPRQTRTYMLQEADLEQLHEWLSRALGYERELRGISR